MFFKPPIILNQQKYSAKIGRPKHYPTPDPSEDLLFFVQRNHNANTVIFSISHNYDGTINEQQPMKVQWIRYEDGGYKSELSILQKKLLYGYKAHKITSNTFEVVFDNLKEIRFFLDRNEKQFGLYFYNNNTLIQLNNIYAHADNVGTFPQLKCIELYGSSVEGNKSIVQKVLK